MLNKLRSAWASLLMLSLLFAPDLAAAQRSNNPGVIGLAPKQKLDGTELIRTMGPDGTANATKLGDIFGDMGVGPSGALNILQGARRGITPITAGPVGTITITAGAVGANSTIQTGSTTALNGGQYSAGNSAFVEAIGGVIALDATSQGYMGVTMTANAASVANSGATPTYRPGHGWGIRFMTDAPMFDFSIYNASLTYIIYVTDLSTGQRFRASANDLTAAASNAYHKVEFGASGAGVAGQRVVEIYPNNAFAYFRSINVPNGYAIWRAPVPKEARIAIEWDSWGDGQGSGNTNGAKLTVTDYLAEQLGITNPIVTSRGGTGFLNPNANNIYGTYRQRVANGDLSVARLGVLDGVILPASVNDSPGSYPSDAALTAEVTLTVQAAMAAQPTALIIGWGPQGSSSTQARHDAVKAGYLAAANGDPRVIYIDNSPSGENWIGASNYSIYLGSDVLHPNDAGMAYYGRRAGRSIINAIRSRFPTLGANDVRVLFPSMNANDNHAADLRRAG